MSKAEFLKRLEALLLMLEEDEVRDILNEYEQHIDMRVSQGLSEQEAIGDFGSVEELASEILSAYHVRPDFKTGKGKKILPKMETEMFQKVQDGSKKALDTTGTVMKNAGTKTGSFLRRMWNRIVDFCKAPGRAMRKFREKRKNREKKGGILGRLWSFCKGCIRLFIRLCYGCIFLCTGMMEALTIGAFGMLLVLLFLGYPVIGLTIAALGIGMILFVITFYAGKKMRRR